MFLLINIKSIIESRLNSFSFQLIQEHYWLWLDAILILILTAFCLQQYKVAESHDRASVQMEVVMHCYYCRDWWEEGPTGGIASHQRGEFWVTCCRSSSIGSFPLHPVTVMGGAGALKRKKKERKEKAKEEGGPKMTGGQSCDTTTQCPHWSTGAGVEVMWLCGDLRAQCVWAAHMHAHTVQGMNMHDTQQKLMKLASVAFEKQRRKHMRNALEHT